MLYAHDHLFRTLFCFADLQNVNITLRILFRPVASQLPKIYMSLGEDYDERVLPSITSEVLKAIVVSILKHVFCSVVLLLCPNFNFLYPNFNSLLFEVVNLRGKIIYVTGYPTLNVLPL